MEEQKYFIPKIEDIYSGYQYERERNGKWEKVNEFSNDYDYDDNPHYALMRDIEEGKIRVPYLTKEQIEDEGWNETELTKKVAGDYKRKAFIKNNYFLIWDTFRDSYIEITLIDPSKDYRFMSPENFKCTMPCKDINELRYICKLLKI